MAKKRFFWSSVLDCVLQEQDGAGQTTVAYTHEPSLYGPLVSENRGGQASQYHFDALGSTRALTDDAQAVTNSFTYDAWGAKVLTSGAGATSFSWIGQLGYKEDTASTRFSIRMRTFAPLTARWLSPDTIPLPINPHPYTYVANNPAYIIDPSGLEGISFSFAAFIGVWRGTWLPQPGSSKWYFKTDERGFGQAGTSRLKSEGRIDSCAIGSGAPSGVNFVGTSHRRFRYDCCIWMVNRLECSDCYYYESDTAPLSVDVVEPGKSRKCESSIYFKAAATYPFAPPLVSPAIDYNVTFKFIAGEDVVLVLVSGRHDKFPDYDVVVDGQVVYAYQSPDPGPTIWNLGGGPEIPFHRTTIVFKRTSCACMGTCQ